MVSSQVDHQEEQRDSKLADNIKQLPTLYTFINYLPGAFPLPFMGIPAFQVVSQT